MRDLATNLQTVRAISPAAALANNNPVVGSIVDLSGYEGCMFAIAIGALAAGSSYAVTMDHGDDPALADAAAVPAAVMTGTLASAGFAAADANKVRKIGYVGRRRYVRLTITPSGNAGPSFVSATAVLGEGRYTPGAQS